MKIAANILASVLLVIGIYLGGYWLFIKENLVSRLPGSDDPFQSSGVQKAVKDVFEPVRKIDLQLTHDRPLREHFIGSWTSASTSDFVRLQSDGSCEFRLGEFAFEGTVEYGRSYAGFSAEFSHNDAIHIFILSYDTGIDTAASDDDVAIGFIGHEPEPFYRETDYMVELAKNVEQADDAN